MSKVSVFDQGWIDLVFEGRNQEYGAYQLRQQDSRTTVIALFSGIALITSLVCLPLAINYFTEDVIIDVPDGTIPEEVIIYDEFKFPEPPKPQPIQQQAAAAPQTPEPTVKFTTLVATQNPVTVNPPTTAVVQNTNPSTVTAPGAGPGISIGPNSPTGVPNSIGVGPGTETGNRIELLGTLDSKPEFPGGIKKFMDMVGNKFNTSNLEQEMTVKVLVSFVIERDGSMTDIRVTRDPGHGLGKEALRVLSSIKTKWKPGRKGGEAVRTAYSLPIVVNVH